ncbi:MAG: M48 family metallopeptidase [Chloroflexi bacterium]|nr:M48 family metallopeptidase [Chloroflexota bacterium]
MPELHHPGGAVPYEIVRSRRRSMCIEVQTCGKVVVRVPLKTSGACIGRFVIAKGDWIARHFARVPKSGPGKQYLDGETFPFLGKPYSLKVLHNGHLLQAAVHGEQLVVSCPAGRYASQGPPAIKAILSAWYSGQAKSILLPRVAEFATTMGLSPSRARVRTQRYRWGSCSQNHSLNFNTKLVMAPPEIADYVIIHELCHIREHNHSKKFWDTVERFDPDYRRHRRWLAANGPGLEV